MKNMFAKAIALTASLMMHQSVIAGSILTHITNDPLIVDLNSATSTSINTNNGESLTSLAIYVDISICSTTFTASGVCRASSGLSFPNELGLSLTHDASGTSLDIIPVGQFTDSGHVPDTYRSWIGDLTGTYTNPLPTTWASFTQGGYYLVDMSIFDGLSTNTTWTVTLKDTGVGDPKRLNAWGISGITTAVVADVPVPATLALLGLGLIGIGFNRKK